MSVCVATRDHKVKVCVSVTDAEELVVCHTGQSLKSEICALPCADMERLWQRAKQPDRKAAEMTLIDS